MFFSANIQDFSNDYREMGATPTANSAYSWHALQQLLGRSGWRVLSRAGKNARDARGRPMPIQDSLLCSPTSHIGRILRRLRQ